MTGVMVERGADKAKSPTRSCWSWSGAAALDFAGQTHDLEQLVAMLPEKKSSDDEILAFVVDLRARFQRWLHQDEFGPSRRQQTAALRALKKSLQTLRRQLAKSAPSQREQLDAMLRSGNGILAPTLERIYEAAGDLERHLRTSDSPNREVDWALKPVLSQRWRRANPWTQTQTAKSFSLPFGINLIHYRHAPLSLV
jgi:hypothetical protein